MMLFKSHRLIKKITLIILGQVWLTFMIGFPYIGASNTYTPIITLVWMLCFLLLPFLGLALLTRRSRVGIGLLLAIEIALIFWIGVTFLTMPLTGNTVIFLWFMLCIPFGVSWCALYMLIQYIHALKNPWTLS